MRRIAAVTALSVLVLGACAEVPPSKASVEVMMEGPAAVVIVFAAPTGIEEIRFDRAAGDFRESAWEVVTTGYGMRHGNPAAVLGRLDGAEPLTEVHVRMRAVTFSDPRRYEPVMRFSDGSLAVYHGYLSSKLLTTDGDLLAVQVPVPGLGYGYLGGLQETVAGGVHFVLDPELPDWMGFTAKRRVPALLAFLSGRLGMEAPPAIRVMIAFDRFAETQRLSGSASERTVQLLVSGGDWVDDGPWAVERFERFLAHEAVHLWNAVAVPFRPGTPPWLFEGTAEALAERSMQALGWLGEGRFDRMQQDAAARCRDSAGEDEYACGHVRAARLEARIGLGTDSLFDFWAGLLAAAAEGGDGRYGLEEYLAVEAALSTDLRPLPSTRSNKGMPREYFPFHTRPPK